MCHMVVSVVNAHSACCLLKNLQSSLMLCKGLRDTDSNLVPPSQFCQCFSSLHLCLWKFNLSLKGPFQMPFRVCFRHPSSECALHLVIFSVTPSALCRCSQLPLSTVLHQDFTERCGSLLFCRSPDYLKYLCT